MAADHSLQESMTSEEFLPEDLSTKDIFHLPVWIKIGFWCVLSLSATGALIAWHAWENLP